MAYSIVEKHFCTISGTPEWQGWLAKNFPDLHAEFIAYMRVSSGCRENRLIMLKVYDRILSLGGEQQVNGFLLENFPYALEKLDDELDRYFTGTALTVPKRAKIPMKDLPQFTKQYPYVEHLAMGEWAYVEYLTPVLIRLLKSIPERSWIIRRLQKSRSVKDI